MNNPKVSIIILNWNGLKDTIECLESVKKIDYPNYEIIVVDNASSDGSTEKIKELFPEVILLKNKENLGYAEGNNVGIRFALQNDSEYILLLNNDTIVDLQILKSFVNAANKYPEAGIFGAKIYFYSEPNKIWFAGAEWEEKKMHFVYEGYGELDNKGAYSDIKEIDYAAGCTLFFRKEVVQAIGLLEQKFFLTFEETDFCFRAKKAAFKSIFVPNAKIWHKISVSFGGERSPLYVYFYTRNRLLWAMRNLSFLKKFNLKRLIVAEFFYNSVNSKEFPLIKRIYWDCIKITRNPLVYKAKLFGLLDFCFARFGGNPKRIKQLLTIQLPGT